MELHVWQTPPHAPLTLYTAQSPDACARLISNGILNALPVCGRMHKPSALPIRIETTREYVHATTDFNGIMIGLFV